METPNKSHNMADTAILLAISTGMLYVLGYSHLQSYYLYFNIPVDIMGIPKETIIVNGIPYVVYTIILLILLAVFYLLAQEWVDKNQNKYKWIKKITNDNLLKIFSTFYVIVILFALFIYTTVVSSDRGMKKAQEFAYNLAPVVKLSINNKENEYGFIYQSSGKYYLFDLDSLTEKKHAPNLVVLREDLFNELSWKGNVHDYLKSTQKNP